jgi:hypothetical protein
MCENVPKIELFSHLFSDSHFFGRENNANELSSEISDRNDILEVSLKKFVQRLFFIYIIFCVKYLFIAFSSSMVFNKDISVFIFRTRSISCHGELFESSENDINGYRLKQMVEIFGFR